MNTITHITEPDRLWLTWQPISGGERFLVGQLDRQGETVTLAYHSESPDFNRAKNKGFQGHPAFSYEQQIHTKNVLMPFVRRLPPRKRADFKEYLQQHLLPSTFDGSDFALLAYTGAKLPSDGFALLPDFSGQKEPVQFVMEVAGTRYQRVDDFAAITLGASVQWVTEPNNPHDEKAVAIFCNGEKIGYVNKILNKLTHEKLSQNKISGTVAKKNGTTERPLIYLHTTLAP